MKGLAIRGFLIWAVATAALRLAGQYVFRGGSGIPLLLVSLPLMIGVALALLRPYRITEERALGAIVLVAPGMILDTVSAMWFPTIFPNIRADAVGPFGGWLLFCNVVFLLTAISTRTTSNRTV